MRARLLSEVVSERGEEAVAFLVVETHGEGVALHRYDGEGRLVRDSVHGSVEEARACAEEEFGAQAGRWGTFEDGRDSVARRALERARVRFAAMGPRERVLAYARVRRRTLGDLLFGADGGLAGELLWCGTLLGTFLLVFVGGVPVGVMLWQDVARSAGFAAGEGVGAVAALGIFCMAAGLFVTERRYLHGFFAIAAAMFLSGWVVVMCILTFMHLRPLWTVLAMGSAVPFFWTVRWRLRGVAERMEGA
jgi:hypothetical protein